MAAFSWHSGDNAASRGGFAHLSSSLSTGMARSGLVIVAIYALVALVSYTHLTLPTKRIV